MSRRVATAVDRRQFLAHAAAGAVAATVPVRSSAAATGAIRIGLIGCGGRGTGAVAQALAAHPAVRLVAMGDLFADQAESSRERLVAICGPQAACRPERLFVGVDAAERVLAADIDLVVLAAPPHVLPRHLVAAVQAGVHVYCEAPVAIDLAGVHAAAEAVNRAEAAGLSIASGLCFRHDAGTSEIIDAVRRGGVGDVRHARVAAHVGLPWRRPMVGGPDAAARERNWVSFTSLSGGPFVEHHVHAIDKALWALGDALPEWVEARFIPGMSFDGGHAGVTARYGFADGRIIDAVCHRRAGAPDHIVETIAGSTGTASLLGDRPTASGGRFQATMTHLVHALHEGRRVDEGRRLCASTAVAVMGRLAAQAGRRLALETVAAPLAASSIQSARA